MHYNKLSIISINKITIAIYIIHVCRLIECIDVLDFSQLPEDALSS